MEVAPRQYVSVSPGIAVTWRRFQNDLRAQNRSCGSHTGVLGFMLDCGVPPQILTWLCYGVPVRLQQMNAYGFKAEMPADPTPQSPAARADL